MSPPVPVGAAPIPTEARSVLVFGGSFDPPTRAHLSLPIEVRDRLGLEWLLFVPAARSPLKVGGPEAGGADRVAMLVAGLDGAERAAVSTIELDRDGSGPSYTVDTLRALRAQVGERVLMRLLIGADQARVLHQWRDPRGVIALAEPVVMTRAGVAEGRSSIESDMRAHWSPEEMKAWRARLLEVTRVDGSATEARSLLKSGGGVSNRLGEILTPPVMRVIAERGLYGDGPRGPGSGFPGADSGS